MFVMAVLLNMPFDSHITSRCSKLFTFTLDFHQFTEVPICVKSLIQLNLDQTIKKCTADVNVP